MTPKSKSKSASKNTFIATPETNMSPELEVLRCRCCLLKWMVLCKWHKNHSSENQYIPWKSMVGKCISLFRDMLMLVFGVYLRANMLIYTNDHPAKGTNMELDHLSGMKHDLWIDNKNIGSWIQDGTKTDCSYIHYIHTLHIDIGNIYT